LEKKEFLSLYYHDPFVKTIATAVESLSGNTIHIKGLTGSMDMLLLSAISQDNPRFHLVVAHDKEEATLLTGDLVSFADKEEPLLFPSSYKVPYQFEEVENANVLMRAEILNKILTRETPDGIIITYPDALYEKVINKRSLKENTFTAQIGEKVDVEFIAEMLSTYDFEKTDFVYEPGQFAIRGGIIDVFSYANELPFRLELFGREIESIRTFDPDTQLSIAPVEKISIIPNIQTKMKQEVRQSFLDFLPENTTIWIKDYQLILDMVEKSYQKVVEKFGLVTQKTGGGNNLLTMPEELFENYESMEQALQKFSKVEFGNKFYLPASKNFRLEIKPQPSFNKNFDLLVNDLVENEKRGILNIICSESGKQMERLTNIFHELDPTLKFQPLHLDIRAGFIDHSLNLACYTDHQIFDRYHLKRVKKPSAR
jgi:transcription-repair coupling factor (superfamily II helicase)